MTSDNPVCFSEYIDVNGVNTHVLKYDYDRKENLHQKDTNEHSKRCDVLVLLIPGNPGIVGFYEDFMLTLYDASSRRVPVWGISHAGHELTPGMNKRCCTWKHNEKLNLRGQVKHKVDFIKNHISPDTKVILIGHSIGCYIILEILKELPRLNVLKCVLLFPTIEGMWESPKGTWMAPFLVYLRWVAILPVYLASYLSPWVQWNLIQWYFKGRKVRYNLQQITASRNIFIL
ncbi:lipid droplet-associated hydrolase-like [Saccoglossus kowalevskii]|uniref:Lipid droplet-associated hydrolase n=1 Tax=Saccoglossus kowalevskii TaxID=10224 RepID=A0ABM0LZ28_SACKO|nr:PREDICTED: UPF0554 protein C2orf43 homolog [Saccoglossus kowalevskii]